MWKRRFQEFLVVALLSVVLGLAGCVSGGGDTTFTSDNGSISIALSDPASGATLTNISTRNVAKVSVTVRDPAGKPVPNTVVAFTTSASLATMIPASGAALTDAAGVASIQIIGASPTAAGATTIAATAQVNGAAVSASAGFGVIATSTGATGISIALIDPVTGTAVSNISTGNPARVTVTLRDISGAVVPNTVVTFTTTAALASMIPATGTALTDASGVASIQVNAADPTAAGATIVTAAASVGGASLSASVGFGVIPTGTPPTGTIKIDPITDETLDPVSGLVFTKIITTIKARDLLPLNATVTDARGNPLPNTIVIFASPAALITMFPSSGSVVTDAKGKASIQIAGASQTAAGAATITATANVSGTAIVGSFTINVIPTQSAEGVTVKLTDPATGAVVTNISWGKPARVTAAVKNATGAAVSSAVVTFNISEPLATMTPSSGTALTDANGLASIQIDPSSPLAAGATTINATANVDGAAVIGSANFSVTPTSVGAPGVTVVLTDASTGNAVSSISPGNPAKVKATIRNAAGSGVPNTVVTFITTAALAAMTPSTGTALTDASGVATIQVDAASLTAAGATTITASASVEGSIVSGSTGFSVSAANAALASMTVGSNPLSPYATTSVSATVTGVPVTTPVTINFSSICAGTGKATLPASVQTSNGIATATYTDKGCASLDTITASVAGLAVTRTITLDVKAPGAVSIQFVSATPSTIVLKGTGGVGLVESSLVRFRVVDSNNLPVTSGVNVTFDLTTWTGGILLDGKDQAFVSANGLTKLTDANGEASVTVQSGTTPTAVSVKASLSATTLLSQSNQLRISTGRPSQDRFSLSLKEHNIDGWLKDGVTTTATVMASDRLGNPVPDGTAINFISEGGQIEPSCATVNGTCNVKFTSANPRPADGRVTVVAYALGEESFVDANGNNKYDSGETFTDLGDAFIDNNEKNGWESGEQSISYASNSQTCSNAISTSPSAPSKAGSCDGLWGSAHVRQSQVIALVSGLAVYVNKTMATPDFIPGTTPADTTYFMVGAGVCSAVFTFYAFDLNRNPLPIDTTLSLPSTPPALGTVTISPEKIQDSSSSGGTAQKISISKPVTDGTCVTLGTAGVPLSISFKTPGGSESTATFTIKD